MRVDTLPSPGQLSMGINLRSTMARAISAVEIAAGIPGRAGVCDQAKDLDDFLVACRAAIAPYVPPVA